MPIRSKEERRALHTTPSKNVRSNSPTKGSSATKITRQGKKLYQESIVEGQALYVELKTNPESVLESSSATIVKNLTVLGGTGTETSDSAPSSHGALTGIDADQHHSKDHTLISHTDVAGITGTGKVVMDDSATLITPALGTPASGVLTNCTGYTGDTSLVTSGALNSGSITSGFTSIDIGSGSLSTTGSVTLGATSFGDNNITNVGSIDLDSITSD